MRGSCVAVAAVSLSLGVWAAPVAPQGLWTEASTIGYGATALGLGIAVCWSCDYGSAGVVILAATVAGLFAGHRIGGSAEAAARRGERPTAGQLWGARVGTVTAFAALGAAVAVVIINETSGNAEGEDERRLLSYSLVGAGLGVIVEVAQEAGLSNDVATAPSGARPARPRRCDRSAGSPVAPLREGRGWEAGRYGPVSACPASTGPSADRRSRVYRGRPKNSTYPSGSATSNPPQSIVGVP